MNVLTKHRLSLFFIFALCFFIPLIIWNFSVDAKDNTQKNSSTKNEEVFTNIRASDIGKSGVAISSRL